MKTKVFFSFVVFTCIFITNCERGGYFEILVVYKTKADYSDKLTVQLSHEKNRVTAFPAPWNRDDRWPMSLANGYLLHGVFGGFRTGITALTWDEYSKNPTASISSDSLYKILIDKDPFLEYYNFDDHKSVFSNNVGIDTARLNEVILAGELEKYFTRVK